MKYILFVILLFVSILSHGQSSFGSNHFSKPEISAITFPYTTSSSVFIESTVTSNGGAAINKWYILFDDVNPPLDTLQVNPRYNVIIGYSPVFIQDYATGLSSGTYYAKVCVSNVAGETCTSVYSTTISPTVVQPSVETYAATSVTTTSATLNGEVTDDGGATVTDRGFVYSTDYTFNNSVSSGVGVGTFNSNLTGLISGTYYYKAYATNSAGTSYGDISSFTLTAPAAVPTVVTTVATSISTVSAVSGGNVTNSGSSSVTERGVYYSTSPIPTSGSPGGVGTGVFTVGLNYLTPNTTYYYRAYAKNTAGTGYGTEYSFTTLNITGLATVSTTIATSITTGSATLGGNVLTDGGSTVTARGVCYGTSPNPTTGSPGGTGLGSFTVSVSYLSAGTTYYYRAYAVNSTGIAYGTEYTFTTPIPSSAPVVATLTATEITTTTAIAGGNISYNGNSGVTESGVCYSTDSDPSTSDSKVTGGATIGGYYVLLSSLTPNTTYYYRAYAINSVGTGYGTIYSFTTLTTSTIPTVTTASISSITSSTASGGGNVTSDGGSAVITRGVVWNRTGSPSLYSYDGVTSDGSGTGSFTSGLTGLLCNTTYYVKAFASNANGTAYGNQVSFTTSSGGAPTATTGGATNITYESATLSGSVTYTGCLSITGRGIRISLVSDLSSGVSTITSPAGTGVYYVSATLLTSNTTYYYQAYVTNSITTSYGSILSFTTSELLCKNYGLLYNYYAASDSRITSGGGWVVPDSSDMVQLLDYIDTDDERTENYINYPLAGGLLKHSGTEYWGLDNGTDDYNFSLYGSGVKELFVEDITESFYNYLTESSCLWTTTKTVLPSTVYDEGWTVWIESSTNNAYMQPLIAMQGFSIRLVRPATASEQLLDDGDYVSDYVGNDGTSYNAVKIGTQVWLAENLRETEFSDGYYIPFHGEDNNDYFTDAEWSALTTAGCAAYENDVDNVSCGFVFPSVATFYYAPTVTTDAITSIAQTTATGGGEVTATGGMPVTARGVCWSTSANPTTADSKTTNGSGLGDFVSSITSLTAGTLYHVRAYATNDIGTSYGSDVTFTTEQVYEWDIEEIVLVDSFDISGIDTRPQDISFNSDGTKMYILGSTGDYVYEYSLSTAWDVDTRTSTYNYSVSPSETVPQGLYFKPDGTKMYVTGSSSDAVREYNLSVAWDLSTVSYVQNKSISSQTGYPTGVFFKSDGTKMYVSGQDISFGIDFIYEYDLGTAWNVSTASYLQAYNVTSAVESITDVFFKDDGTKAYIPGYFGVDKIIEAGMDAWDISTITIDGTKQLNNTATSGIYIKSDGTTLFLVMYQGGGTSKIYKYTFGE